MLLLITASLAFSGCASQDSPTSALVSGEITADEYLEAVRKANQEDRTADQLALDQEPVRAFNTKTGRVEFVPENTSQKWNEEKQRWEFTPID